MMWEEEVKHMAASWVAAHHHSHHQTKHLNPCQKLKLNSRRRCRSLLVLVVLGEKSVDSDSKVVVAADSMLHPR
jgi:hypothetical protein